MKKATLLLALLFTLVACQSRLTPTPMDVSPSPSVTPSPTITPTPNATERYQGTLQANQTANAGYALTQEIRQTEIAQTQAVKALTPTLTPTVVPTYTPLPTSTPIFSALIPPLTSSSQYKLTLPSSSNLIKFSFLAMLENQKYSSCSYDDVEPCDIRSFKAFDAGELEKVIDFEFDRLYPFGLTDFEGLVVFLNEQQQEDSWFYWLPETISGEIDKSVVQYLSNSKIVLRDKQEIVATYFEAQVNQIEIDGDPEPEWLLRVVFPTYWNLAWITLNQDENQKYSEFSLQLSHDRYMSDFDQQAFSTDITGDGLTDTVLVTDRYVGGGGSVLDFEIRMGTPEGLKLISHIDVSFNGKSPFWNSYEWIPASENSLPTLKINYHTIWSWGCETDETAMYTWKNGVEKLVYNKIGEPDTVQCAIGREISLPGYSNVQKPDNATAIRWLNLAIQLNDASSELKPEELVFVYYRLALLYALNQQDADARQYLGLIQEVSLSGQAEIATYLWGGIEPLTQQNRISPFLLCKASIEVSLPISNIGVWGDIFQYPYQGLPDGYPTQLCDIRSFQFRVLDQLTFISTESLEYAIQKAQLPVHMVQPVHLATETPAWLVVLEQTGQASIWDGVTYTPDGFIVYGYLSGYGWEEIATFPATKDFRWINSDLTGDGFPELALAVQFKTDYCPVDTLAYDVLAISNIGGGVYSSEEKTVCIHEMTDFDWNTILEDNDGDGLSDFAVEQAFFNLLNDRDLFNENLPDIPWILAGQQWSEIYPIINKRELLTFLDEKFFTSPTPSLLRPDIEFYRSRWGTGDDPTSEQIYAHLTYLLALTYELDGDETQAVELFYDIWVNHPDTLWAYLASARLALKP